MEKYLKDSIEDWAIFFIDTGLSFPSLVDALTGNKNCIHYNPQCPKFNKSDVEITIQKMIISGTLACGPAYGWDKYLIVRDFMPNTANRIENKY